MQEKSVDNLWIGEPTGKVVERHPPQYFVGLGPSGEYVAVLERAMAASPIAAGICPVCGGSMPGVTCTKDGVRLDEVPTNTTTLRLPPDVVACVRED